MRKCEAVNNASLCFNDNMLKMLLSMELLTNDEYERISLISTEYYCIK